MSVFQNVFDISVHFFCLYHMQINLKEKLDKGWTKEKRAQMGIYLRECAYELNRCIFNEKIAISKEVGGESAEEWLVDLLYKKWAAVHYG